MVRFQVEDIVIRLGLGRIGAKRWNVKRDRKGL